MTEIHNIEERLKKVCYLIPEKYAPMLQQLLDDCRYLLKIVKNEEQPDERA